MSIAPQPMSLPAGDPAVSAPTAFDARGVATEMMGLRGGTPEQIRSFADRMREMPPEQRAQVAEQFRQMRGGANAAGTRNANPSAVPMPGTPHIAIATEADAASVNARTGAMSTPPRNQ